MNKFFTLSVLTVCAPLMMVAQSIEIGSVEKAPYAGYEPTILGEDDNLVYVLETRRKKAFVSAWDKGTLSSEYINEVKIPDSRGRRFKVLARNYYDGKIQLITSNYDRKRKQSIITAYIFDAETGELDPNSYELMSIDARWNYTSMVKTSLDRSKIFIATSRFDRKKRETQNAFVLLDPDMSVLASNEFTKKGRDRAISVQYYLDDFGTIYGLYADNSKLFLDVYDAASNFDRLQHSQRIDGLGLKESIFSGKMTLDTRGDIVYTGYYVESRGFWKMPLLKGFAYIKIDGLSKEIAMQEFHQFDKKIERSMRTRAQNIFNKEAKIRPNFVSEVYPNDDGSVLHVGELQKYYYVETNGATTGEYFHYNDLLICSYDTNGVVNWQTLVEKDQIYFYNLILSVYGVSLYNSSGGYSLFMVMPKTINAHRHFGYLTYEDDDYTYIMFYDHPHNAKLKGNRRKPLRKINRGNLRLVEVDKVTGKARNSELKLPLEKDLIMMGSIFKGEDGNFYVFTARNKKYRFGVMSMD